MSKSNRPEEDSPADYVTRLESGQAWDDFCDALKAAGQQIRRGAPDDTFDRAEGYRYLARLTHHFLRSTIDESDPAKATIASGSPKIGLDNPDYVYTGARLSPEFSYCVSGELHDADMLGIGIFSGALGTPKGLIRDSYITTRDLDVVDGKFDLQISREHRPGNWLAMGEGSNSLNIRQTLLKRRHQKPAEITLVRTDSGAPPAPLAPDHFVGSLDRVGQMVGGIVAQFLAWTTSFKEHPFEIREIDPHFLAIAQGDPNTTYHYSYWELEDDEIFTIVLEPPAAFDYWNLQIGNHWLESFDSLHYDTHVNHETAVAEPDGTIRISICSRDPGRPNWLDTAGHRRGALALRWVGADTPPRTPRTWVEKRKG